MYRGNADLASLLQRSLYQLRQYRKRDIQAEPTNIEVNKVLDGLNDKILEQCQQVLTRYQTFCDEYSTIDIDEVICDINPELWNAVCLITRSASERKGVANKQVSKEQHKKAEKVFLMTGAQCPCTFC